VVYPRFLVQVPVSGHVDIWVYASDRAHAASEARERLFQLFDEQLTGEIERHQLSTLGGEVKILRKLES
jgi:hypothetical protein